MTAMKKILFSFFALCFATLTVFCGYRITEINAVYENESQVQKLMMEYKPQDNRDNSGSSGAGIVNQSIVDLQCKYPDAAGWLTIPNTEIDYPFVWCENNDYYLNRDIDGNYAPAGTIFMETFCNRDFTSHNTILYGHHMKNNSMFGSLKLFDDEIFFEENKYGTIYLPNATLTLEIFAYMVVNPDTDREVYSIAIENSYFDYVKNNPRQYRDIGLDSADRIVTLSSCSYEFEDARMVLLTRIKS